MTLQLQEKLQIIVDNKKVMRFKKVLIIALAFSGFAATAQSRSLNDDLAKKWLVCVEGDTITAEDFWYVFNKNATPEDIASKDSLNNYRELYSKFLLKVKEAKSLGYDTTYKFIKEFKGYKDQLAESYLKDKTVTDKLVKEAYERSIVNVEASHILIGTDYHALPNDTLKAYKLALKIKNLAESGQDFKALAKQYSTDPSAKRNGGYLGFFGAFKMVYPFESAAFNTKPGDIAEVFRSRFGYHVVKVHSKRDAVGEIKVSHIMTVVRPEMTEAKKKDAEQNIYEIYAMLQKGENFRTTAQKFSEDLNTARKGGELGWFGPSKFVPEFENAAFNLDSNMAYSKPIKTIYGWHIIQRLDRKDIGSFKDIESELKTKVARSDRAELSKLSVINRIKKEYGFVENRDGIDGFYEFCDTSLISGKWQAPAENKLTTKMFDFAGKTFTQKDFALELTSKLVPKRGGDYRRLVNYSYDSWIENLLKDHEKAQLPNKDENYVRLLKEYEEGIILFDLTSERVWNKSVSDTAGLNAYYKVEQSNWTWDERMDGVLYKCINDSTAKKLRKYLKKGKDDVFLLEEFNKKSKLNIRVEAGVYEAKERPVLKGLKFKKGISKVINADGTFIVLKINNVIPVQNKELPYVKGLVTARYQDYLMNEWLNELNAKYKVKFNEEVYNQLIPE